MPVRYVRNLGGRYYDLPHCSGFFRGVHPSSNSHPSSSLRPLRPCLSGAGSAEISHGWHHHLVDASFSVDDWDVDSGIRFWDVEAKCIERG